MARWFSGTIEYYDHSFIRLTRKDGPNLFIYKHDIKYIVERLAHALQRLPGTYPRNRGGNRA